MVRVRIQKIIWDETIIKHINKHNVTVDEAEKVIFSDAYILDGHSGKRILINKVGNRMISVVVKMSGNKLRVFTARDADKEERQGVYGKIKNVTKI